MSKTINGAHVGFYEGHDLVRRNRAWEFFLEDTREFRFTDAPHEVEFEATGGLQKFTPVGGGEASADRFEKNLSGGDREYRGYVESSKITDEDFRRRLFRRARILEYVIDGTHPWKGPVELPREFYAQDTTFDGDSWVLDMVPKEATLNDPEGGTWSSGCKVEVYSQGVGKCNVDRTLFTTATNIGGVNDEFFNFTLGITAPADGTYDEGTMIFRSGPNVGLSYIIKSQVGNVFALHEPTAFPVTSGVFLDIILGCNHESGMFSTIGHCKNRFANLVNFQGDNLIPGLDKTQEGLPV